MFELELSWFSEAKRWVVVIKTIPMARVAVWDMIRLLIGKVQERLRSLGIIVLLYLLSMGEGKQSPLMTEGAKGEALLADLMN